MFPFRLDVGFRRGELSLLFLQPPSFLHSLSGMYRCFLLGMGVLLYSLSHFHTARKKKERRESESTGVHFRAFGLFKQLRQLAPGPFQHLPVPFLKKKTQLKLKLVASVCLALSFTFLLLLLFTVKAVLSLVSGPRHLIGSVEFSFCVLWIIAKVTGIYTSLSGGILSIEDRCVRLRRSKPYFPPPRRLTSARGFIFRVGA